MTKSPYSEEPILGIGVHTGQTWIMGEEGPEWVTIPLKPEPDPAMVLRILRKVRDYLNRRDDPGNDDAD